MAVATTRGTFKIRRKCRLNHRWATRSDTSRARSRTTAPITSQPFAALSSSALSWRPSTR